MNPLMFTVVILAATWLLSPPDYRMHLLIGVYTLLLIIGASLRNARRNSGSNSGTRSWSLRRPPKYAFSDGLAFEEYLKRYYTRQGYKVSPTATTGDYGVDLLLNRNGNRRHTIAVQAKNNRRSTGIAAIQQVASGTAYYKAHESWVVASNYYTPAAKNLAKATGVRLFVMTPQGKYYEVQP